MGRTVRQKRKNRSSRPKIKQTNQSKKKLNPLGNSLIAQNWDKKETLTQNYRRLGLLTRLGAATGGTAHVLDGEASGIAKPNPLKIDSKGAFAGGALREVRVERDAQGRIVRVIDRNPLNDPLAVLDSDNEDDEDGGDRWDAIADPEAAAGEEVEGERVADRLERLARRPVMKEVRTQSSREGEWLERLVSKHGDDTKAMARDHRLNPMQQTAADIARRIKKWKGGQS